MPSWSWTGLGAVLLCALLAAPAKAAFERAPIELGPGDGDSPSVVVDSAGTAHVAWGAAEELIGYCAIPRGARAHGQAHARRAHGPAGPDAAPAGRAAGDRGRPRGLA